MCPVLELPRRRSYFGVITAIQAIILLFFSIFFILNAYCVIDSFDQTITGVLIRTTYLHAPGICGNRVFIGELVEGMNNRAFIQIDQPPFTYYRTLYLNWANLIIALIWIISNELMFRNFTRIPWTITTLVVSVLDFSVLLIYINDTHSMKSLPNLLWYIGASSYGTGNILLDTGFVAPIMAVVMAKCSVFIIINTVQIMILASDRSRLNQIINPGDEILSPENFIRGEPMRMPIRLPRPRLLRNDRFATTMRLQEIVAACSPVHAATPEHVVIPVAVDIHTEPASAAAQPPAPTNSPTGPRGLFYAEDIRIRVPEGMLSLPQRLEKIIAEEARKFEVRTCKSEHRLGNRSGMQELRRTNIFFSEVTFELPEELEEIIIEQTKYLNARLHPMHADRLSTSLPIICDGQLYPVTDEPYQDCYTPFSMDAVENAVKLWAVEEGHNCRLRSRERPCVDSKYFETVTEIISLWKEACDNDNLEAE